MSLSGYKPLMVFLQIRRLTPNIVRYRGVPRVVPPPPGTNFWHRLAEGVGQSPSFTLALPCNRAKVGQSFALGWGQEGWDKVNLGGTTRGTPL